MKKWLLFSISFLLSSISIASPLPAEEVFQDSVKQIDPNNFIVNFQIKPGYFLYSDRIKLTIPNNSNLHLGEIRFPHTLKKTDQQGKVYNVYRKELTLPVGVLGEKPGETIIELNYQGCSDDGFCYPPQTQKIRLGIDDKLALNEVMFDNTDANLAILETKPYIDKVEFVFHNHHWTMILLTFFGFGLLLSFTPCVLPMVPVLSGIIIGHGNTISTRKAFFLSLSYVLSMALTYAIVGAVVALLGSNLQIFMQSPWAISIFSFLFVLLALSMFGFYELKLPVSWQARLAVANRSHASGHYISAAIMGCLSTLILSPCVTAPLIGVLSYIAHSGDVSMGFFSLFFLSLGMGTPLILIGTSAGRWLPQTGSWMNAVKYFFGVMLLAVAIYLLTRILPASLIMGLWATLLIFSGVYCGALVPAYSHHEKFRQASGIILLVYGLLILIGASMGSITPLQPLAGIQSNIQVVSEGIVSQKVDTLNEVEDAIANARGKPIMLDFYADWCESCKTMEATTFKDPKVIASLNNFSVLKADITANSANAQALLQKFNVVAPPTFLFFDKKGKEISQLRLVGAVDSAVFLKHLTLANNRLDKSSQ